MTETLIKFLSMPVSLTVAIGTIPVWVLLDIIFHGKVTNEDIVYYLLAGAVFSVLAFSGNLTVWLGLVLVIPLIILSDYLEKKLFKKENGDGNG